ncbi:MAG: ferrous iron transport protein A [Desulfobulbaceae bacterium]|nr:MAG: ferrous iron transport protein A [Desulfobulbaceae bacterium]
MTSEIIRFFCSNKKCREQDKGEGTCARHACAKGCMPLSEVKPGSCVCVKRYNGCGQLRRRLLDLGLTPQARVDVVRRAPLGDPILLKVGDFDITLSESEALHVEVAPAE